MGLNNLWDLIDVLDQASRDINCLPFFFFFLSTPCSLLPLPWKISYSQSLVADAGEYLDKASGVTNYTQK